MLLDDEQIAINELISTGQETADHYEDAVGRIDDAALGELFDDIRSGRLEAIEGLCRIVRESGELPRAAYADREFVEQIVTRVKAALSADARAVLLDTRIGGERQLDTLAEALLARELPAETRARVEAFRAQVSDALARLEDARRSLPS